MLTPQNIKINITPEKVWTILAVIDDFVEDSDTEFVVENEKNEEGGSLDSPYNNHAHAIVYDKIESVDGVDDQDKCPSEEKKISAKERNLVTYAKHTRTRNKLKCDGDVLIPICPLDDPPMVFQKVFDFDEFQQHLIIEMERYATQKDRSFVISLDMFDLSLVLVFPTTIILGNRKPLSFSKLCD